jgi:Na+/H+-dicarboxylate symporter
MSSSNSNTGIFNGWRNLLLWKQIAVALILGVALGVVLNITGNEAIAATIKYIGTAFVSLIKMLIVPLIFVSLVCGMTSISDMAKMGRIGLKAILFYLSTTAFAITVGLGFGILFQPGIGIDLTAATAMAAKEAPSFITTIIGIIPTNPVAAAADGNVL